MNTKLNDLWEKRSTVKLLFLNPNSFKTFLRGKKNCLLSKSAPFVTGYSESDPDQKPRNSVRNPQNNFLLVFRIKV